MSLETAVRSFVEKLEKAGGKPLYELTPQQAREVLLQTQANPKNLPNVDYGEIVVPLGNGRQMRVAVVKPFQAADVLPFTFYLHGGGWVMGNEKTHMRLISELVVRTNSVIVFPIYELSPEVQYPQTTNDLFTVLQYISEHAAKFNLDAERLAVAGDSAGGNMALVMSLMAKKNKFPKIIFQLLLYPVTDASFASESYKTFADGPWLTRKAMQWFWNQYAPDIKRREEIYASPIKASLEDLSDLPPTLLITDENDVLRDEGEAFARKLDAAGVETSCVRINGTIHDFLMLDDLASAPSSKTALLLCVAALKEAFETGK